MKDNCCHIKSGDLDQIITIERPSVVIDAQGGRVKTWAPIDVEATDLRAKIEPLSGNEARRLDRVAPGAILVVYIWYRADANGAPFYTPSDRVVWRGRYHNIVAAYDYMTESKFMYLMINEGTLS